MRLCTYLIIFIISVSSGGSVWQETVIAISV